MTKRPVAFRVPRMDCAGTHASTRDFRLFSDEGEARAAAEELGLEYEGLYVVSDRASPMTDLDRAPSSIRDDSICESSLNPNKSSGDIGELKPCPFCGGPAGFIGEPAKGYNVRCRHCLATSGWGDYGYQVSGKWNSRLSELPGGKREQNYEARHPGEEQMVLHPLSDIRDLDDVVRELGIEASDETPAEAVRALKAEIEALSVPDPESATEIERLRREVEEQKSWVQAWFDQARKAVDEKRTAESAVAAARSAMSKFLTAWNSLPEGNYTPSRIDKWLNSDAMKEGVSAIRAAGEKKTAEV